MAQQRTKADPFAKLTWDDLEEWAGSTIVSRGRGYQRGSHVQALARTPNGGLVAWVYGTHKYATRVEIEKGKLFALCSCPYGGTCKHAVAVVLVYLDHLKQQQQVPTVTASDRRLKLLDELDEEEEWDEENENDEWDEAGEEDEEDEDEEEEWDEEEGRPMAKRAKPTKIKGISSFLQQQTKEQLIALVKEQAKYNPTMRQALQDRVNLSTGAVKKLVREVREEIEELNSEPDWEDDWYEGEGSGDVDYSRLRSRLEGLLGAGRADDVVDLGKDLLEAGTRHVEMIHDEGESGEQIALCMDIIFRALPQSSLSPAEQMWAIDAELEDEYELCRGVDAFWKQPHTVADWEIVADKLTRRLKQFKSKRGQESYSYTYRRDHLSNWIIQALEHSGRHEEIIPLCEREAEETANYLRLVNYLREAKRWKEAEEWIHKGIKATQQRLPGIADQLRTALREMREREKDWPCVAAFHAEDFFQQPSLYTFQALQKAATKAGVWPAVRTAAMHYLETGELPQVHGFTKNKKQKTTLPWPLPPSGVQMTSEREHSPAPMIETLIDIAIAEKRPDDVLRWYDQRKPSTAAWGWGYSWSDDDKIAQAIMVSHPDRAIAIWKKMAEDLIAQTNTRSYELAAMYLRKVLRIMKEQKQMREWENYLTGVRQANARKKRLIEILDRLENRRILG